MNELNSQFLGRRIHSLKYHPAATTISTPPKKIKIKAKGRHDVCVVPRAVPVVEAMAAVVMLDHFLRHKAYNQDINN